MFAVKIKGEKQLEVVEDVVPVLEPGKVLIKVLAVGICGSDLHFWKRGFPTITYGHEFCGEIVDPGDCTEWQIGDRVGVIELAPCLDCAACRDGCVNLCQNQQVVGVNVDGGACEYFAARADMIRKLPDAISNVEGAMIEPVAVSMHGARLAGVKEGSRVLVTGAGPIGTFAAACAKALGAGLVVVTEVNEKKLDFVRDAAYVDVALDGNDPELEQKLKEVSEGGFDIALECTGITPVVNTAMAALRHRGHLQLLGIGKHLFELDLGPFLFKEASIRTSWYFQPEDYDLVIEMLADKRLQLMDAVTVGGKLADAQQYFELLASGTTRDIKIVLQP